MDHSNHNTPTHRKREAHDKHEGHSPDMFKRKFIVSLVLTAPVLIFTPAVQGWLKYAIDFPGSIYIPAILGLVIFVYGGLVFLRGAKRELANKQPGMMTLVAMAISVAFGYSLAVSVGIVNGMDFWWELATLVTIMLLGHWLEMASVQNAQGALGELAKLLPDTAEVIHDDTIMTMPVGDLKVGDAILIRPGAQVPIDGTVTKGKSDINESMLTGESKPVMKTVGDMVTWGFFYFIDPSLIKNRNFYQPELKKLQESWGVHLSVSYGQDMFNQLGYPNIWLDIMANLQKWRHDIPDLPNVNFDTNPEESAEEIKDLPLRIFRKLFDDERIVSQILPVLFPTGATLAILEPYFRTQSLTVTQAISSRISTYLNERTSLNAHL